MSSAAPPPLPAGLANLGNTCSVNALTQCLFHCPRLLAALSASGAARARPRRSTVFADEFSALFKVASSPAAPRVVVRPNQYIRAVFDAIGDGFRIGEQHDLTELWLYLCDALTEEYGDRTAEAIARRYELPSAVLRQLAASREPAYARMVSDAHSAWAGFQKASGVSPFQDATQGLLISQVQCQACQYICHNFEPFTVLSLELPDADADAGADALVHVHECLTRFYHAETLASWKCDRCGCCQSAEKVMRIWTLPTTLVVALKRFKYGDGRMKKIRCDVEIPMEIHFYRGSVLGHVDCDAEDIAYHLRAFGNHHGGEFGGHYTAVGCRDDAWYFYDDEMVIAIDMKKKAEKPLMFAKNPDVYLLFYERGGGGGDGGGAGA